MSTLQLMLSSPLVSNTWHDSSFEKNKMFFIDFLEVLLSSGVENV
jgi:hypothetical protein